MQRPEEPPVPVEGEPDLRDVVLRAQSSNPAIQRLQHRLLADVDASEVITSYDRMHHRHNRS